MRLVNPDDLDAAMHVRPSKDSFDETQSELQ